MNVRKLLRAIGWGAEKNYDPLVCDSRYYHSKENCGVELDISRRGNVFCSMHRRRDVCHCGWEVRHHYEYVQ